LADAVLLAAQSVKLTHSGQNVCKKDRIWTSAVTENKIE